MVNTFQFRSLSKRLARMQLNLIISQLIEKKIYFMICYHTSPCTLLIPLTLQLAVPNRIGKVEIVNGHFNNKRGKLHRAVVFDYQISRKPVNLFSYFQNPSSSKNLILIDCLTYQTLRLDPQIKLVKHKPLGCTFY